MTVIGVLDVQGAVSEHVHVLKEIGCTALRVKNGRDLREVDGIIIPGGESTTISRLLLENNLFEAVKEKPILGTCAGMVLLAKEGDAQVKQTGQKLLGLMDMQVNRNAFGRQRESFEKTVKVSFLSTPFLGVFIRAPAIERVWGKAEVAARLEEKIVGVQQGKNLALSFHPELSGDKRIHEYFAKMVKR